MGDEAIIGIVIALVVVMGVVALAKPCRRKGTSSQQSGDEKGPVKGGAVEAAIASAKRSLSPAARAGYSNVDADTVEIELRPEPGDGGGGV